MADNQTDKETRKLEAQVWINTHLLVTRQKIAKDHELLTRLFDQLGYDMRNYGKIMLPPIEHMFGISFKHQCRIVAAKFKNLGHEVVREECRRLVGANQDPAFLIPVFEEMTQMPDYKDPRDALFEALHGKGD